jgi:predicted TIM-barrel fold metal-dependent hydrolase
MQQLKAVPADGIIDFGVCPPAGGFLRSRTYLNPRRTARWGDAAGMPPAPSLLSGSMADLLAEMDAAGVAAAVVRGHAMGARLNESASLPPLVTSNAEIRDIVRAHPGRFVGMPTIPHEEIAGARELIPKLAGDPDFHGLVLHPHSWPVPVSAADRTVMYPIYTLCEELGLPLMLTIGGNAGPNLGYNVPLVVDQVASDFPGLTLVIAHGDWPYVTEILHVAFRRENLVLSPDMYLYGMPGWRDYLDAANGFLQDRFLYASMHPYVPLTGAVAWCREHLSPDAFRKVTRENAVRLLAL